MRNEARKLTKQKKWKEKGRKTGEEKKKEDIYWKESGASLEVRMGGGETLRGNEINNLPASLSVLDQKTKY